MSSPPRGLDGGTPRKFGALAQQGNRSDRDWRLIVMRWLMFPLILLLGLSLSGCRQVSSGGDDFGNEQITSIAVSGSVSLPAGHSTPQKLFLRDDGRDVASAPVGSDGEFALSVAPGEYTVVIESSDESILVAWLDVEVLAGKMMTIGLDASTEAEGRAIVRGIVVAEPTCPVEGPGIDCKDRPVEVAQILLRTIQQDLIAKVTTDKDGAFSAMLPAGQYTLEPQPVEGLLVTPKPQTVDLEEGESFEITFVYDTGLR